MSQQKSLFSQSRDEMRASDLNRPDAALWVREVGIFRSLDGGTENEVRRIKLRRGLNILWARPEAEHGQVRLYEAGLSGHASGKTTFCRMLRHILGEKHFANELVTRGVRERFDGGWVLGEVFIDDHLWLVGRPFTLGAHPFCVAGLSIDGYLTDKPEHQPYQTYLDEVTKATVNRVAVKRLPRSGEEVQWSHLLQWLTRDQECRFIQITDWRSKLSKSDSPDIPSDDQHSLMRSVVGVLSEEERDEIEKNAKLNRQKEAASAEVLILQRQAQTDHQRLEEAVGSSLPTPDSPLLVERVRSEITDSLNQKDSEIRDIDNDSELVRLRDEQQNAVRKTAEVQTELRLLEARRTVLDTKLKLHQREKTQKSAFDFAAGIPPGEGFCRVPIEKARAEGCTLAYDQPRDLVSEAALRAIADGSADVQEEIDALSQRESVLIELLEQHRQREHVANRAVTEHGTHLGETRAELYRQKAAWEERLRLAQRAHVAWQKADQLSRRIESLEKDVEVSRNTQATYRAQTRKAVSDLSLFYQEIVRARSRQFRVGCYSIEWSRGRVQD